MGAPHFCAVDAQPEVMPAVQGGFESRAHRKTGRQAQRRMGFPRATAVNAVLHYHLPRSIKSCQQIAVVESQQAGLGEERGFVLLVVDGGKISPLERVLSRGIDVALIEHRVASGMGVQQHFLQIVVGASRQGSTGHVGERLHLGRSIKGFGLHIAPVGQFRDERPRAALQSIGASQSRESAGRRNFEVLCRPFGRCAGSPHHAVALFAMSPQFDSVGTFRNTVGPMDGDVARLGKVERVFKREDGVVARGQRFEGVAPDGGEAAHQHLLEVGVHRQRVDIIDKVALLVDGEWIVGRRHLDVVGAVALPILGSGGERSCDVPHFHSGQHTFIGHLRLRGVVIHTSCEKPSCGQGGEQESKRFGGVEHGHINKSHLSLSKWDKVRIG